MPGIPSFLLRHEVVVEPLIGEGPFGSTYGPRTAVRCFRDDKRRLVRGTDGSEVVSETTLYMRLSETCPVGSRVTLDQGTAGERVTTVITAARRDGGGLPTPDHLEVTLL
ncbi:hypothetical protein [Thermomonospora cellulosilytica]|uniref:Uncharacterized protein n=1 Tax=Thermomonospora cellulosilytica TaxID=1411118 RepID=A0A7W3R8W5_9ACTN|nr:hypothetical protein [Thermomonospora cellulosilytica]MBA9003735.1 hypothetical protein [Thermomonospora cellulosilytica]